MLCPFLLLHCYPKARVTLEFNMEEKIKKWDTNSGWDTVTSELPFALLSKSRATACSSLSSSSSPRLGCFPLPYFGMKISVSQSKVCQIWRKITRNCPGQLLITAG